MGTPGRLLEVQALDLEADGLLRKRAALPEREILTNNEAERAALGARREEIQARHDDLSRAERELGGEVGLHRGYHACAWDGREEKP